MNGRKKKTIKLLIFRLVITALALVFCAGAASYVSYTIVNSQDESTYIYMDRYNELLNDGMLEQRDIAIVPGAAVLGDTPTAHTADRLDAALALYNDKLVKEIIVSGGNTEETSVMAKYLMKRGVEVEDLESDHYGVDTYETLARIKDKHHSVNSNYTYYLCTQEMYANRAMYLISGIGIQGKVVCVDTMFYSGQLKNSVREFFAATKAVFEVAVYKGNPKTSIKEMDFITVPVPGKNATHIDVKDVKLPDDYQVIDENLSDGYDVEKAVEYARKYALEANKEFALFSENCTNFVSQCLLAGGIEMRNVKEASDGKRLLISDDKDAWFSLSKKSDSDGRRHYSVSTAFVNTTDFINHFTNRRGYELTQYENTYEGKVECYNAVSSGDIIIFYNNAGAVEHIGFVTGKSNMNAFFCANTNAQLEYSIFNINDAVYPKYGVLHITYRN